MSRPTGRSRTESVPSQVGSLADDTNIVFGAFLYIFDIDLPKHVMRIVT